MAKKESFDPSKEVRRDIPQQLSQALDPEPVLTVDGASKLLGLSINTVYAAVSRGEIPHRRVGRKILFSRAGLLAWLEQSTQ